MIANIQVGTHIDTRAVYHPGPLYEDIGIIQEHLVGGGFAVRYLNKTAGYPSTVADFTASERSKVKPAPASPEMRRALIGLLAETQSLMEGEACDHSVGICYCATFDAMDTAEALIKATEPPGK